MSKQLRIAVADDEADMRDYLRTVVPRLGHVIVGTAASGLELLELCRSTAPDLVISDLRMPDMNGDEAIRQYCAEHPVPSILVTAYHDASVTEDTSAAVPRLVLNKPISRTDLARAIAVVSDLPPLSLPLTID